MSTQGCTVGMQKILINGVMYEAPTPVCDEIEQKNNGIEQLIRYIEKSPVLLETVIIERLRSIQSFQTVVQFWQST